MPVYIDLPIDADPEDILNDAYTYLEGVIPGWTPADGNLDVWLLHAISSAAAELKAVASSVPSSIFRWFGANLINLPPVDATQASTTITVTVQDNAGYTIPNGTQISIDKTGDVTIPFHVVGDQVIPAGSTVKAGIPVLASNPGADGSGIGAVSGPVHLLDPISFITTITQDLVTTGGVDAEDDPTYLNRLVGQLQLLAPRPILAKDFAVFARNIAGVFRATAIDMYNPIHNLLTANQASAETDATGWISLLNATLASTAAQALDGAKSVQVSSVAAGDMAAGAPSIVPPAGGSIAVTPGDTVTGLVSVRSAVSVRSCSARLYWYTSAGVFISSSNGAAANDSTTLWTNYSVTAVAPATAAFVRVAAYIAATGGAAEVHYVDKASIRRGSTTDWVPGGTGETGQPRTVSVAAIDASGAPVSSGVKAAITADLQGRREVNFLVYVIDPVLNQVDVTYQVKASPGYDLTTLVSSINAALNTYLNAANWGTVQGGDPHDWNNNSIVRYLEVAALINSVDGVDYITTTAGNYDLQIGPHGGALTRTDFQMAGIAALPQGGTFTGVAT